MFWHVSVCLSTGGVKSSCGGGVRSSCRGDGGVSGPAAGWGGCQVQLPGGCQVQLPRGVGGCQVQLRGRGGCQVQLLGGVVVRSSCGGEVSGPAAGGFMSSCGGVSGPAARGWGVRSSCREGGVGCQVQLRGGGGGVRSSCWGGQVQLLGGQVGWGVRSSCGGGGVRSSCRGEGSGPAAGGGGSGPAARGGGGSAKIGQHREYLLHGGRYASCVHAGGLSCKIVLLLSLNSLNSLKTFSENSITFTSLFTAVYLLAGHVAQPAWQVQIWHPSIFVSPGL